MPFRLLSLLVLLAACEAPTPPAVPAPPTPLPTETTAISTDDRALATKPVAPLRVEGACPFEGCTYTSWTTSGETAVYAVAGDTSSTAFMLPAGTHMEADRGFVLLTRIGVYVADRPTEVFVTADETHAVAAGDTLLVLDYEGEGSYRVWHGGVLAFSGAGADLPVPGQGTPALRQTVEPAQQWWAHVHLADGRDGWLWMDETPPVEGADAFG